jgi:hypothetical protein
VTQVYRKTEINTRLTAGPCKQQELTADNVSPDQRAARGAIMRMRLFPDLDVALKKAMGYGPHVDMVQHFCYWFHPRHPKMQNRWTLYKTYAEWRDECGLARKQVDKGREKLRDLGLVTEKKGPRARIFYRVDWVALAQILSLSPVGEQTDELDDWFDDDDDEFSLSPVGEQGQFVPQGEQASLSPVGEHTNSGEYAGEYETGDSLLQSGSDGAFAPPSPQEKNGKTPDQRSYRQEEETRTRPLDAVDAIEIEQLVLEPDEETRTAAALEAFYRDTEDLAFVVGAVRADLGLWYADPAELEEEVRGCIETRDKRAKRSGRWGVRHERSSAEYVSKHTARQDRPEPGPATRPLHRHRGAGRKHP